MSLHAAASGRHAQMMAHLKTEGLTLAAAIQERTEMADGVEMLCFPIRLL